MGGKKEGNIIIGQIGGEGLLWRENMVGGPRAWHVPGAPQHGDPALVVCLLSVIPIIFQFPFLMNLVSMKWGKWIFLPLLLLKK